ncbi:MAG: PhoU domain-containing protein, partial [Nitrosopumilaceae archaeon]|nr:PhoU domain-containing protein [Nitrosopumilaceae archaeon]
AKILKRMSSIALGMFDDILDGLISEDKTNLQTLSNRDVEVNRQYFLLVRLIRSTLVDARLSNIYNLENIDVLDYRIAANLLENAGDVIVELADSISDTDVSKDQLKKIHDTVKNIEEFAEKSIDAFITHDRRLAIEAINLYRLYQKKLSKLKMSLDNQDQIPINYFDLVYMFERIGTAWADVADLVKPIYNE